MLTRFTLVLATLALLACGTPPSPATSPSPTGTATPTAKPTVPGPVPICTAVPPVYHPARLRLLGKCEVFRGIVVANLHETDGDHHLWISPDPGYEHFLNAANTLHGSKALVAEIVPACTTPPASSAAAAMCPPSRIAEPTVRQHVEITGPWVVDTVHAWQEIHPVLTLMVLPASTRPVLIPGVTANDQANGE
jgi:hypothetical protein